ncbi:MAG: succinylglutamate desuccinylase/aspartoacylase family protein [Burkholderiales bacterium]|nr:succinylglutamate desuccinylase/aspartoacylase family protein [Burkholderiales bacterium]
MPVSKNKIQLPAMTPGTTRSIAWLRYGKSGARPKVYLQAAIHANELPGAMLLHHLMPLLGEADRAGRIRGEIIVVPTVNPIGQSQLVGNTHVGRYDLLSRDNFNRNWLDLSGAVAERVGAKLGRDAAVNVELIRKAALAELKSMQPVNELQTMRVAMMKLSIDADVVIDLHCDMEAALHLFTSQPDIGGTAQELAADLGVAATLYNEPYAQALTFSGVNGSLWPRLAERFPAAAIPQACFSTTLELRGQHEVTHALGAADARNLYRYLVRRGVIAGRAAALPRLKSAPTPISGMDVGYCPRNGYLTYHAAAGAKVKKGDAICDIIDPADPRGAPARTPMRARTDGILFSRKRDGALVWPGAVAFRIAGAQPLAHRKGMSGLDD